MIGCEDVGRAGPHMYIQIPFVAAPGGERIVAQVLAAVVRNRPPSEKRPSKRTHNGADARSCSAMLRQMLVERSSFALSMNTLLETEPVASAKSAISQSSATAGGPAQPQVSREKTTKRQVRGAARALFLTRPRFSLLNPSLASQDAACKCKCKTCPQLMHVAVVGSVPVALVGLLHECGSHYTTVS